MVYEERNGAGANGKEGGTIMTVIEALRNRRAIRNYTAQPVEQEKIAQILQAATFAPNDRMREPWHFM